MAAVKIDAIFGQIGSHTSNSALFISAEESYNHSHTAKLKEKVCFILSSITCRLMKIHASIIYPALYQMVS